MILFDWYNKLGEIIGELGEHLFCRFISYLCIGNCPVAALNRDEESPDNAVRHTI